ncbi:hypothetical protein OC846_000178 [Tilletia horrida]|uniref:Uncharacterized protein n=1 Tax=Tilletia horrida TaxID=155126 RepID=A0AAN6JUY1_9BASI|nr:hypothetical protein OC845_000454 [Tilletia horrida]KAK0557883.1 hypothetical protein OC846_000178 [Tilletia horrida]
MTSTGDLAFRRRGVDEASRGRTMRRTSDALRARKTHFQINPAALSSAASSSTATTLSVPPQPISTPQHGRFAFATAPQLEYTEDIGMLAAAAAASSVATSLSAPGPSQPKPPAALTAAAAAAAAAAAIQFEAPTRNATFDTLLPIMASLPDDYAPGFDELREASLTADSQKEALDYILLEHGKSRLPYTNSRLPTIDAGSFQLWNSLQSFRPVTEDYAVGYLETTRLAGKSAQPTAAQAPHPLPAGFKDGSAPPQQCPAFASSRSAKALAAVQIVRRVFNWDSLPDLPQDLEQTWYGVAFRSARREGSESTNLYEADRRAHEEAVASGGLLMYWYGAPHPITGENLATCVWTSRSDAIQASSLPFHAEAAAHSLPAFRVFDLTRYAVRKRRGETKVHIDVWTEDDDA